MEKVHISVYLWSVIMYMSAFMGAVCIFYHILVPNVCVWASTADDGLEARILDAKSFSWQILSRVEKTICLY